MQMHQKVRLQKLNDRIEVEKRKQAMLSSTLGGGPPEISAAGKSEATDEEPGSVAVEAAGDDGWEVVQPGGGATDAEAAEGGAQSESGGWDVQPASAVPASVISMAAGGGTVSSEELNVSSMERTGSSMEEELPEAHVPMYPCVCVHGGGAPRGHVCVYMGTCA